MNEQKVKQDGGEGDRESARESNRNKTEFVDSHDTEKLAEQAEPESESEARELEKAEVEARKRAKDFDPQVERE